MLLYTHAGARVHKKGVRIAQERQTAQTAGRTAGALLGRGAAGTPGNRTENKTTRGRALFAEALSG